MIAALTRSVGVAGLLPLILSINLLRCSSVGLVLMLAVSWVGSQAGCEHLFAVPLKAHRLTFGAGEDHEIDLTALQAVNPEDGILLVAFYLPLVAAETLAQEGLDGGEKFHGPVLRQRGRVSLVHGRFKKALGAIPLGD